jgi:hypothetical protein
MSMSAGAPSAPTHARASALWDLRGAVGPPCRTSMRAYLREPCPPSCRRRRIPSGLDLRTTVLLVTYGNIGIM